MSWVAVSEAYVARAMPSELVAPYAAWLVAHPDKSGRLAAIVGSVLADFRAGLENNPASVLDSDTTALPEACLQHALTIIFYHLALEMGLTVNLSVQTAFSNAQVYLRRLYTGEASVGRAAVSETPSYEAAAERGARMIDG